MKFFIILVAAWVTIFIGCSSTKKKEAPPELRESELASAPALKEEEFFDESAMNKAEEDAVEKEVREKKDIPTHHVSAITTKRLAKGSSLAHYKIQQGDTLLYISFKLYGDYRKWREIKSLNSNVNPMRLREGQTLRYHPPHKKFVWRPAGIPHLIVRGETLGTISQKYYMTPDRWKEVFEHNRPLILDPDLIFAGFSLYYQPDTGRVPASLAMKKSTPSSSRPEKKVLISQPIKKYPESSTPTSMKAPSGPAVQKKAETKKL